VVERVLPLDKGGFGSKLKAQGARMATKKTTNFESCRDLTGQRLKTIHEAKALAEYIAKEPERGKAHKDEIERKIKLGLKERERKRGAFDDDAFEAEGETYLQGISDAVSSAVGRSFAKAVTAPAPVKAKKISGW
jgi:Silencing defective 2 N-terminal ubiquitin domain